MVHGLDDKREADRPVVASTSDQPDADGIPTRHKTIAVMLDLRCREAAMVRRPMACRSCHSNQS